MPTTAPKRPDRTTVPPLDPHTRVPDYPPPGAPKPRRWANRLFVLTLMVALAGVIGFVTLTPFSDTNQPGQATPVVPATPNGGSQSTPAAKPPTKPVKPDCMAVKDASLCAAQEKLKDYGYSEFIAGASRPQNLHGQRGRVINEGLQGKTTGDQLMYVINKARQDPVITASYLQNWVSNYPVKRLNALISAPADSHVAYVAWKDLTVRAQGMVYWKHPKLNYVYLNEGRTVDGRMTVTRTNFTGTDTPGHQWRFAAQMLPSDAYADEAVSKAKDACGNALRPTTSAPPSNATHTTEVGRITHRTIVTNVIVTKKVTHKQHKQVIDKRKPGQNQNQVQTSTVVTTPQSKTDTAKHEIPCVPGKDMACTPPPPPPGGGGGCATPPCTPPPCPSPPCENKGKPSLGSIGEEKVLGNPPSARPAPDYVHGAPPDPTRPATPGEAGQIGDYVNNGGVTGGGSSGGGGGGSAPPPSSSDGQGPSTGPAPGGSPAPSPGTGNTAPPGDPGGFGGSGGSGGSNVSSGSSSSSSSSSVSSGGSGSSGSVGGGMSSASTGAALGGAPGS